MLRWSRTDAVLALLLMVSGLVESVLGLTGAAEPWYVVLTVPVATLPVAFRRTHTAAAVLVFDAAVLAQAMLGSDLPGGFTGMVVLLLMVYAVGSRTSLRPGVALLGATLLCLTGVIALGDSPHPANFAYMAVLVGAGWAAGVAVRLSEERGALLAERQAMRERTRIAGELHDVVSHNVSAIVVQAAAERRDQPTDSPAAEALSDIERHGRATLTELRRLLGVLRIDGDRAPLTPQPDLGDLSALVDATTAAGLATELRVHGEPVPLAEGTALAGYRVVQEALTNVRKHSAAGTATVILSWGPCTVEVEVQDPGPGRHLRLLPGGGYGLRGLAERVQACGGSLTSGPAGAGFRVRAVLPAGRTPGEVG